VFADLIFPRLQRAILSGHTLAGPPMLGMFQAFVFVPNLQARTMALSFGFVFAIFPIFGILVESWKAWRDFLCPNPIPANSLMRWGLLGLAGSWMVWYLGMGMYFIRYLFPAYFLGSLFAAAMLYDLTFQYDLRATIQHAGLFFFPFRSGEWGVKVSLSRLRSLAIVVWLLSCMTMTALSFYALVFPREDSSPQTVAAYLTSATKRDALIESYETELMFLTPRRFHYPPDQVSTDLSRRKYTDPMKYAINYDPLQADPDYLVVGWYNSDWDLYQPWQQSGDFQLIKEFPPRYKIYARVRH
jgi:hypothetical protein